MKKVNKGSLKNDDVKLQIMGERQPNISVFLNLTWQAEEDYNQTLEDLELREYIKTLMTIGLGSVKRRRVDQVWV